MFTITQLKERKAKEKITMLTAYDYPTAKLLDQAGVDILLVGDSLGMVVQGYNNTLQVTVDDMIYHTKAVKRGADKAFILSDLPFLSYHITVEDAVRNAGRLIQEGGASAVKLEGGRDIIPQVKGIIKAQIPVVGHLGLTPQSIHSFGGFRVQAKEEEAQKILIEDAKKLEEAGVSAIVLEAIPTHVAKRVTELLSIPTIGIGASKYCDGQVLVTQDMLGLYDDLAPKFVKQFGQLNVQMEQAIKQYIKEVKSGEFPEEKHSF